MPSLSLPSDKWGDLEAALKQVGQCVPSISYWHAEALLATLGYLRALPRPTRPPVELPPELWKRILLGLAEAAEEMGRQRWELTTQGKQLYMQMFVWRDDEAAAKSFAESAARHPVIDLVLRAFYGRGFVTRDQLTALLKLYSIEYFDSGIESFLDLLRGMRLIELVDEGFIVNEFSSQTSLPDAFLLTPDTPYSNKRYVRRLVASCEGVLYWIDKFFAQDALEYLVDGADATKLGHIVIVSGIKNATDAARHDYAAAKSELGHRGIHLEWRICTDVETLKVWHGRWIVSDAGAYNIPPARSLVKGQYDEIVPTDNRPPIDHFLQVSEPLEEMQKDPVRALPAPDSERS